MSNKLKEIKEIVNENPILIPVLINSAVVVGLTFWVAKNNLNSYVALKTSVTALKVALGEEL